MRPGDAETVGTLLARIRAERGISQLRLAEQLCAASGSPTITRHEVSRWEREDRVPNGYWRGWLAAVLELPLGQVERAAAAARHRRRSGGDLPTRTAPVHAVPPQWAQIHPGVYTRIAS